VPGVSEYALVGKYAICALTLNKGEYIWDTLPVYQSGQWRRVRQYDAV